MDTLKLKGQSEIKTDDDRNQVRLRNHAHQSIATSSGSSAIARQNSKAENSKIVARVYAAFLSKDLTSPPICDLTAISCRLQLKDHFSRWVRIELPQMLSRGTRSRTHIGLHAD